MRKHMTHAEIARINKLLNNGVTDMAEIQAEVFVHEECIQQVVKKYINQTKPKKVATPKKVAKPKKAAVDPIS